MASPSVQLFDAALAELQRLRRIVVVEVDTQRAAAAIAHAHGLVRSS